MCEYSNLYALDVWSSETVRYLKNLDVCLKARNRLPEGAVDKTIVCKNECELQEVENLQPSFSKQNYFFPLSIKISLLCLSALSFLPPNLCKPMQNINKPMHANRHTVVIAQDTMRPAVLS